MSEEKKKNNHPVLKTAAAAAAVGTAAYTGFSYYIFRNAFDRQNTDWQMDPALLQKLNDNRRRNDEWFSGSCRRDVFIDSFDGLKLHATAINNHPESHHWVLFAHSYNSYGLQNLNYLYEADQNGFNVLAVDQRSHGMSGGRYSGMGWPEHYDLISWINWLVMQDPESEIALYGVELGAAAVMNAAGDYIPKNAVCAIEDSGYSGIEEELEEAIKAKCRMPGNPFVPGINLFVRQFLHFNLNDANTRRQLMQCSIPMLFIHGEKDDIVPCSMVYDSYYACASAKELYTVSDAGHNACWVNSTYFTTVFAFIKKYMHEGK